MPWGLDLAGFSFPNFVGPLGTLMLVLPGEAQLRLHVFLIELGGNSRTLPGLVFGVLRLQDFRHVLAKKITLNNLLLVMYDYLVMCLWHLTCSFWTNGYRVGKIHFYHFLWAANFAEMSWFCSGWWVSFSSFRRNLVFSPSYTFE